MMNIEQKAREIAESVSDNWEVEHKGLEFAIAKHAARLGIIEGVKMAHERIALIYGTESHAAKAIRALIEEQKL